MTDLPRHTRLLQIEAPGRAVWKEAEIPALEPDEVLVKMSGITTCPHWDLHMMRGEPMFPGAPVTYPLTLGQPGHEATGEIVVVGKEVLGFTPGMRVAAWRDPGDRRMGCYAQYVPLRAVELLPIDAAFKPEEIASLELAMCVQGSINQMKQRDALKGKRVAISGLGPSGLIAVQLARIQGAAAIIGLDLLEDRRKLAIALGADEVWDPREFPWPRGRFTEDALDSALDTTGLPLSIEALLGSTRETVAVFGVLRETVRFGPEQWWGGFGLLGYATHTRQAAEEAYRSLCEGTLRLSPLVTTKLPFTRYAEGVEMLRTQLALKILFDPWE